MKDRTRQDGMIRVRVRATQKVYEKLVRLAKARHETIQETIVHLVRLAQKRKVV